MAHFEVFGSFAYHEKFELKSIDRLLVFPSIVLKDTCQERLREEEPWDPEIGRSSLVNPFLHKFESFYKVIHPTA